MLLVLFLDRFSNIFVMNKIDEVIENCMNGKWKLETCPVNLFNDLEA